MSQNLLFNPKPLSFSLDPSSQYKIPPSKPYQSDITSQYKPARSPSPMLSNSNQPSYEKEPKKTLIQIMIKVKSNDCEDHLEPMTICIISTASKTKKFQIEITTPHDPLVLYTLDMSEVEYHQLKNEQGLLIDFQNFTPFLINMLDTCLKNENFICVLHKKNVNEALFVIQERTKFKEINHLILNVVQANDLEVKKYLGAVMNEFKIKFEETSNSLKELTAHYEELDKENLNLKEKIQKDIVDKQTAIDNVINEKNKEINLLKEKSFQYTKEQLAQVEKAKNQKISELEKKIENLQNSYDLLNKDKIALDDYKMKLEMEHKDLESKHAISSTELNVYKGDIVHLREENSSLNQKCYQQEKELTEYKLKYENLLKQLEEKDKGGNNLSQLVETLTKQRESNEDTIKSLKAQNSKIEDKLQQGINEINKGNEIIQKLQNEIKTLRSKNKTIKQALTSQEQLTNQKQSLLDDQIRSINELKRDNETKQREISGLNNEISSLKLKLSDNEKIIEDNKQMLMYLNKKVNDSMSKPFRSVVSDPMMQTSQSSFTRANNFNFNPDTNYQNNFKYTNNDYEQFSNSGMNQQNQLQSSNNSSGLLIMPETNFCGYKPSTKMAGTIDKYFANTANSSLNGNLLNHKYGMMSSTISNDREIMRNSNSNFEEEFPRQMTQPQSMIMK